MYYRICKKCGIEKNLNLFYVYSKKDVKRYGWTCLDCKKLKDKQYYLNNKEKMNEGSKNYHLNNKEKVAKLNHDRYLNNKEKVNDYSKAHYNANKAKKIEQNRIIKLKNKENNKIVNKLYRDSHKEEMKLYRLINKEELNVKRRIADKIKMKADPAYKLRKLISGSIRDILFSKKSKKNASILKYLSYNMEELKIHIEAQFESWMTWDNHGQYKMKNWNDNNSSTWVWNIDHIIPQADLPYFSMEDDNFKKCWALENLRPYSAKQNVLDGLSRVRHKKKIILAITQSLPNNWSYFSFPTKI